MDKKDPSEMGNTGRDEVKDSTNSNDQIEDTNREIEKIEALNGSNLSTETEKDDKPQEREDISVDGDESSVDSELNQGKEDPADITTANITLNDEEKAKRIEALNSGKITTAAGSAPKKKRDLTRLFLIISIIIALAAIGVAVWFFLQANNNQANLSRVEESLRKKDKQYAELDAKYVNEVKKVQSGEDEKSKEATAKLAKLEEDLKKEREYRTITELGVRYKESDTSKDFIYSLTVQDKGGKGSESILVSTRELANLRVEGLGSPYPCDADSAAVGTITKVPAKEYEAIKEKPEGSVAKKLGEAYIVFEYDNKLCGVDSPNSPQVDAIRNKVTESRQAMKQVVESMEEIK